MTDLTKLTAKDLHDMLSTGLTSWTPPLYAVMREFVRRAEGYALACGDRDSARDELAEMKELRDAAKSDHKEACRILRNYQTLAEERGREIGALTRERDELHRRAQANDALRAAAKLVVNWRMETGHMPTTLFSPIPTALFAGLNEALAAAPAAQPTPAAPVTDAEIEAAITALTVDARREADALRVNPEASGTATEKRANRQVQLRALIARRVASAGAAPVDSERASADRYESHLFHTDDGMPSSRCRVCGVVYKEAGFVPCKPAPVDSEREAAIKAVNKAFRWVGHSEDCASHENGPDTCDCGSDDDLQAAKEAVALIARRVASAGAAPAGDQDANALRAERDKLRAEVERLRAEANARAVEELTKLESRILLDKCVTDGDGPKDLPHYKRVYNAACENHVNMVNGLIAELSKPAAKESERLFTDKLDAIDGQPSPQEKQRRSFAFGNTSIENARITPAMIDAEAEKLAKESDPAKDERLGDWPLSYYVADYNPLTATPIETAVYHLCRKAMGGKS